MAFEHDCVQVSYILLQIRIKQLNVLTSSFWPKVTVPIYSVIWLLRVSQGEQKCFIFLFLWSSISHDLKYTKDWDKQTLCNNTSSTEHIIWEKERLPLKSCWCQIIIYFAVIDLPLFKWQGLNYHQEKTIFQQMLVKPCIILVTSKTFLELCTFGFSVLSLTNTETIKEQISMVIKKEANFLQTSFPST